MRYITKVTGEKKNRKVQNNINSNRGLAMQNTLLVMSKKTTIEMETGSRQV